MNRKRQASQIVTALVAAAILSPATTQAASLTLGCAGTLTRTYVPKNGIAREPRKEPVSDYSAVVDLDKHAVFMIASVPAALPIKEANASTISFEADKDVGHIQRHISGGVDRITGAVNADDCYVDDLVDGLIRLMNTPHNVTGPIKSGKSKGIYHSWNWPHW